MIDFDPFPGDVPGDLPPSPPDSGIDVPAHLDVLPDGRETLVIGDVAGLAELAHRQGEVPEFQGTCGICSCEGVLRRFGVEVSERDLVEHAVTNGLCEVTGNPDTSGATTMEGQARILGDFGVPAHVEYGHSLEDLAANVEHGRGIIIAANAGELWQDPDSWEGGRPNHAVTVTGVARDPSDGSVEGFFVNDSGTGEAGKFVDAATMEAAWLQAGGRSVVTDVTSPVGPR
ncbi:C39 family peptidase [Microbispora sp. H13382]|uniref:C39 family peptidase n=1 Tax=Microbispora sp. H13382 TaxID=2729112 RepID=UPI001601FC81|nr:C39 family peptidase [Microbispora sp. H13382]